MTDLVFIIYYLCQFHHKHLLFIIFILKFSSFFYLSHPIKNSIQAVQILLEIGKITNLVLIHY